jgi:serine phosphatase RsbU (regulator of sigma subunit)
MREASVISPAADGTVMRLAIVDPTNVAPPLVKTLFSGCRWCVCDLVPPASYTTISPDCYAAAVLVDAPCEGDRLMDVTDAVQHTRACPMPLLILTDRPAAFSDRQGCYACLPVDSPIERVRGALLGLAAAAAALREMERERANLRRLSDGVQHHIEALDAELRLAARVQQNFVPRGGQRFGPASFATLYRPCSWVSGDLFDIFRLDDRHVGFYVADVVGHGVAAGLVTIYVKHAMATLRAATEGGSTIAAPSRVLARLNDQMAGEVLEESQFITIWYGVLDLERLELRYASAGHPPPLWLIDGGAVRELHGDGGLLGLDRGQSFEEETTRLHAGERILLYSDGLEPVLISERHPRPTPPTLQPGIATVLDTPSAELLAALDERLNNCPGSLNKGDDVSVVVLDVVPPDAHGPVNLNR